MQKYISSKMYVGNICDLKISLDDFIYSYSFWRRGTTKFLAFSSGKAKLPGTHDRATKQINLLDTSH